MNEHETIPTPLSYPAPRRDWQGSHTTLWTPARMAEYRAAGGWFDPKIQYDKKSSW